MHTKCSAHGDILVVTSCITTATLMICRDMHLSDALEIMSTSDARPFTGHETYCTLKTRVCCLPPKLCIQHTGAQALPINNTREKQSADLVFKNTEQEKTLGVYIHEAQKYPQGLLCALVYHLVAPGHNAEYGIKQ